MIKTVIYNMSVDQLILNSGLQRISIYILKSEVNFVIKFVA